MVRKVTRSHRWQRIARDQSPKEATKFEDQVSIALFSTDPDDLGLYGKPMARNAQIWNEDYALILDGPRATPLEIARASATVRGGGRSGYRFYYPPMRAGEREIFWHLPLVARLGAGGAAAEIWDGPPLARLRPGRGAGRVPRPPADRARSAAARPGPATWRRPSWSAPSRGARASSPPTTSRSCSRFASCSATRCPLRSRARWSTPPSTNRSTPGWTPWPKLGGGDGKAKPGARCAALLERVVGPDGAGARPLDAGLTFGGTHTRAFEEKLWKTIAGLAEGEFRMKETADGVTVNKGKTGGPAAKAARLELAQRRDLERLGDHLHERYRALIEAHQMTGRAAGGRSCVSLGDRLSVPLVGGVEPQPVARGARAQHRPHDPGPRTAARR